MTLTKPRRIRDEQYLAWIRTQPCLTCDGGPDVEHIEAHHVREKGKGGTGTKPSDYRAVPLCRDAHSGYHGTGRENFERLYNINLEAEILRLNAEYLRLHPSPRVQRQKKTLVKFDVQHCSYCRSSHKLPITKVEIKGNEVKSFYCIRKRGMVGV